MSSTEIGFLLLVAAALLNAGFTLPMKFTRCWAWENTWLVWSIGALLVLPAIAAFYKVPDLISIYSATDVGLLWRIVAFGFGWGLAQVFFGLAVEAIGIALTFSLVLGTSAAMGALIPMLLLHREKLNTAAGHALLLGISQLLFGVAICAVAGMRRDHVARAASGASHRSTTSGLILAIACGCAASFQNFGLAFGTTILSMAIEHGASSANASNAVWLPLLAGGAIPNLAYCAYLLRRNSSARNFMQVRFDHWLLAFTMAALWFGSLLIYGASVVRLGSLGSALGWPIFMSLIVIVATLLGIVTGEWKHSGRWPLTIQLAGVAALVVAIFTLARASQLPAS